MGDSSVNFFRFSKEIPLKFTKEFPVKFTGDFFGKDVTFRLILKKSYQEGVFDFFIRTPNLTKISNPQEICQDIFYIHIYVYMSLVFNISQNKKKIITVRIMLSPPPY